MAREEVITSGTGDPSVSSTTKPRVSRPCHIWIPSQRQTLLVLVAILAVVLIIRSFFNRQYVSDPQPAEPARMNDLADRLDPNTATAAELTVLPQLREKRAAEIVAFRERFHRQHPGEQPFKRIEDLFQIKGIGPAMLQTLSPHLHFPPTTQRS